MGQFGGMIADAGSLGIRYCKRLVEGIPDDRFSRLSSPGGKVIQANHPAFVLGHLCLYPVRVFDLLGKSSVLAKPPANYQDLFSKDATCVDDPDGKRYPRKQELCDNFATFYEAALTAMRNADDTQLEAENPIENPMKKLCPTIGSMLGFYLTGHVMSHLGQISTWRRMEGLPPA